MRIDWQTQGSENGKIGATKVKTDKIINTVRKQKEKQEENWKQKQEKRKILSPEQ